MQESLTYLNIKGTTFVHKKYGHYSVFMTSQFPQNSQIMIEFSLKPLETMTLHQKKILLQVQFPQFKIQIFGTVSSQLRKNFTTFENIIRVEYRQGKNTSLICQKIIRQKQMSNFSIIIPKKSALNQIGIVTFGRKNKDEIFNCKIHDFRICNKSTLSENQQIKSKFEDEIIDGPIDKIPQNLDFDIDSLPKYESPNSSEGQLYLCHDMMGGYKQDININTPNSYSQYTNTYRCLNLSHTEIFNYFSHHLISIPPQHWRRLCYHSKTKCLGTFIIERKQPSQQQYLTKEFASFLVYLCRKFKFDGFLINIEFSVASVDNLKNWLEYLTNFMHFKVPNSKVIWYDSVVFPSGRVNYQNQLNNFNFPFYDVTDGIFLNYWWQPLNLSNSIQKYKYNLPVYVGNDCFGRGTYGGGQYNIYIGANKIKEICKKEQLKITLFGMGYTYENQAKNDWELWKQHEKAMYRGVSLKVQKITPQQWNYLGAHMNGMKWEIQGQWAVSSFKKCQRVFRYPLKEFTTSSNQNSTLKVIFKTVVTGTPPQTQDPYKITIKIIENEMIYNESSTGNRVASQKQEDVSLMMYMTFELITNNTFLQIQCEASDAQKWGGNYGTRFKNDQIIFSIYDESKDWINKVSYKKIENLPYLNFMNLGNGSKFYNEGKAVNKRYEYMSDQDLPMTHTLNKPDSWSIENYDAYLGGTCLKIEENQIVLCDVRLKQKAIQVDVIAKNLNENGSLTLKRTENNEVKGKTISINGLEQEWKKYSYTFEQQKDIDGKLIFETKNINYLIGGFHIFEYGVPYIQTKINSLKLALSEENPPVYPYVVDIYAEISLNPIKRVLMSCGEQFTGFGWFDEINDNKLLYKNIEVIGKQPILMIKAFNSAGVLLQIFNKQIDMKELVAKKQIIYIK